MPTPKTRPDLQTHLLRKELVRHCWRQGLSIPVIIDRLDAQALLGAAQTYNARYSLVTRLLKNVKEEATQSYSVTQEDHHQAWREYVEQQYFLYYEAVRAGNLALGHEISMAIARAYGINTDAPIRVETNFYEKMRQASLHGRAKHAARTTPS